MRRTHKLTAEGMLIKVLLSTSNLTVKELASRIGKTEATVCDIISGKNKSRKTLNLILDVLREEQESEKMKEFLQLFKEQFDEADVLEACEDTDASMELVVE